MAATDELDAEQIASLATASAYPHDPRAGAGVRWIQTHISHVFLTSGFVYKLRKSVNPAFLDFTGRAERNADCMREVALNRRFSPDVYLGIAPVRIRGARAEIGPVGEALAGGCEHVVVMRRLPDGRDALSLLERGALGAREIDAVATRIAALHSAHGLGAPAPFSPAEWQVHVAGPMRDNVASLGDSARSGVVGAGDVAQLAAATEAALGSHAQRLEARRQEGRAIDGHGDLHDAWRLIDAASEVAFLAMDLRYRGAGTLGERFLRQYAALRDDFGLYGVVDLFAAYRAAVRAKVAALAAADAAIAAEQRERAAESARRHLALALASLRARVPAPLLLVCGSVGTGKSTVAQRLADANGGVVIASDRTRKALAGLSPESRGGAQEGAPLYADAMTARVYEGLLARARPVITSGRPAILDATFSRASQRTAARDFAREAGVPALLVEVRCDPRVARERVALRALRGSDPSDAGPERVEPSRAAFEAVDEWPAADRVRVDTDRESWERELKEIARRSFIGEDATRR